MTLSMAPQSLVDELQNVPPADRVRVTVHDATRLGWNVTVPAPTSGRLDYTLEVELQIPSSVLGPIDLWSALQTDARLDAAESCGTNDFRRAIVSVSVKLARARDGFIRHCTLMRSEPTAEENHVKALVLWVDAARATLAEARTSLLARTDATDDERALGEEYLSGRLWTVLTDCARALFELKHAFSIRIEHPPSTFDAIEATISDALRDEIGHRRRVRLANAEPANALQLERLVARLEWLKRHFERVLVLEHERYEVASRASGWLSAAAAMLGYLWFFFWQTTFERRTATVGWGIIVFALVSALAYASRERLKEGGRNWLAGRVQKMFAQRVTRYRLPGSANRRGAAIIVARESFSRSAAQGTASVGDASATQDVTVVRFVQRGHVVAPEMPKGWNVPQVQLVFRLDLSGLLPRLEDAVRGFATPDRATGRLTIIDVPRNYDLPLFARLRLGDESTESERALVLNKNGLVRLTEVKAGS